MEAPSLTNPPKRQKIRANPTQLSFLAEYMMNHSEMASGLGQTLQGRVAFQRGWAKLARELNSLGPPIKNIERWKQAWRDMRNNVKKKSAHVVTEYGPSEDYGPSDDYGPSSTENESTINNHNNTEQQYLGVMEPVTVYCMDDVVVTEVGIKRNNSPPYSAPAPESPAPSPTDEPDEIVPPPKSKRKRTKPIVDNFESKLLKIEEGKLKAEQDRNIIFNRMVDVLQGINNKLDSLLEK